MAMRSVRQQCVEAAGYGGGREVEFWLLVGGGIW